MVPTQIISSQCVEELIHQEDPFSAIHRYILNRWCFDIGGSRAFEEEYQKRSNEIFEFEKLLVESKKGVYPSIYDTLIQKCLNESGNVVNKTMDNPNSCLILLDALSIREAGIIKHALTTFKDYKFEFKYAYSSLPSDTKHFEERLTRSNFLKSTNTVRIRATTDIERITPSYPLFIRSPFPDIYFHSQSAGYTEVLPLRDIFIQTINMVKKILSVIKSFGTYEQVVFTSDHGYLLRRAGSLKLTQKQIRTLKKTFGGRRHVFNVSRSKNIEELLSRRILVELDHNILVKGMYIWPVGGKFPQFMHGGISLLECLVPVISVGVG